MGHIQEILKPRVLKALGECKSNSFKEVQDKSTCNIASQNE